MIEIYHNDEKLEIPVGTKVRFKKQNPFFAKKMVAPLFSYPFNLPFTSRNDKLLGFARLPQAQNQSSTQLAVVLRLGNIDFSATLYLHKWNSSYKVNLVADAPAISTALTQPLSDFDWPTEPVFEFKDYWYGYLTHSGGTASGTAELEITVNSVAYNYVASYEISYSYTLKKLASLINAATASNDCVAYSDGQHILVQYQHTEVSYTVTFDPAFTGTLQYSTDRSHESKNYHAGGTITVDDLKLHLLYIANKEVLPRMFTYFPAINYGVYPTNFSSGLPYQNFYQGTFDVQQRGTTPFIYAKKLLFALAEKLGYTVDDQLFDTELESLVLYNDKLRGTLAVNGLTDDFIIDPNQDPIDIRAHVPNGSFEEYLRSLRDMFCCGVFIDQLNYRIKLIPMKKFVQQNLKRDATNKMRLMGGEPRPTGYSLAFTKPEGDELYDAYFNYNTDTEIAATVADYDSLPSSGIESDLTYKVTEDNNLYRSLKEDGSTTVTWQLVGAYTPPITSNDDTENMNPFLQVSTTASPIAVASVDAPYDRYPMPIAHTSAALFAFSAGLNSVGFRYLFERGLQPNNDANNSYLATYLATNAVGTSVGNYELQWAGSKGLYNVWWKTFVDRFAGSRLFEFQSFFTTAELLSYDFSEPEYVRAKDYLVAEIDYQVEVGKPTILQTLKAFEI